MATIASALMVTVVCFDGGRRRADREGAVGPNNVPWIQVTRFMPRVWRPREASAIGNVKVVRRDGASALSV
jgi:hypothetical protein